MNNVHIFDLDGTVIDSSDRTPLLSNGLVDVVSFIKLRTHSHILNDRLLPLYDTMLNYINSKDVVLIVTARLMSKSDYFMLKTNKIKTSIILSRDKVHKAEYISSCSKTHYNMLDGEYKRVWFKHVKNLYPLKNNKITVYDDNLDVLKVAKEEGFLTIDAIKRNKTMCDI